MGCTVGSHSVGEMTPEKLHVTEVLKARFKSASPIAMYIGKGKIGSEGKIRFPLSGEAEVTPSLSPGFPPEDASHVYSQTWWLAHVVFAMFLLFCSNAVMSPATLWCLCSAAPSSLSLHWCRLYFLSAKAPDLLFLALPMFCATALLFHFCLSLFPGFWHKPLREIVGSGNNLRPYNLLYLKVPLSSEANSLSLDSVYEPLLLFSPRIPFVVQANLCLMGAFSSPPGSWICMKLGSLGTLG